jgi:restriction endonuclease S subunit
VQPVLTSLAKLKPNPHWARLPLFNRNDWSRVRFGDVVENVNERVEPSTAAEEIYVGLDDLDSGSLHIRRWGKGSDVIGTKLRFRKGDIIFGRRRAYQRKLAVAEVDGICSAHAMVARAKPKVVLPEFLPFLMMSDKFMNRAIEISVGSLSPTINWTTLQLQEFDLPPLDQQRRIAEILWAVDETIEKQLALASASTSAADAARHNHFADEHRFKLMPIRETGRWVSGNTPSRSCKDYWNGSFPWVSPKDMKRPLITDSEEHLSEAGRHESTVVGSGSVLIVIRGMILAHSFPVAITEREVAFNQDMKAVVLNETFSASYLFHWFKWAKPTLLKKMSESSHGTKRLAMDDLFEMKIPTPTRREQDAIVARIQTFESAEEAVVENAENLRRLRTAFLNQVFG